MAAAKRRKSVVSDVERCCGRNRRDRRNLIATVPALTRTVTLMQRSLSAREARSDRFVHEFMYEVERRSGSEVTQVRIVHIYL